MHTKPVVEPAGGATGADPAGSTAQDAQHAKHSGLPLPVLIGSLPPAVSKASNKQPLRLSDRRRRAPPPSSSSEGGGQHTSSCDEDAASHAPASAKQAKPVAGHFADAITVDLRRHGLDLTAPRRSRPPPRDRSLPTPGLGACGTESANTTATEVSSIVTSI